MLYVTNKNNKKEPFGIVGSLTVLTDSNSNADCEWYAIKISLSFKDYRLFRQKLLRILQLRK